MSNKNNNDSFFTNQDTIVRRAWINSALESARSRLAPSSEHDAVIGYIDANDVGQAAAGSAEQPHLYVAWSSQARRSGT